MTIRWPVVTRKRHEGELQVLRARHEHEYQALREKHAADLEDTRQRQWSTVYEAKLERLLTRLASAETQLAEWKGRVAGKVSGPFAKRL